MCTKFKIIGFNLKTVEIMNNMKLQIKVSAFVCSIIISISIEKGMDPALMIERGPNIQLTSKLNEFIKIYKCFGQFEEHELAYSSVKN